VTAFSCSVTTSLREIDARAWDHRLTGTSYYVATPWLSAAEESAPVGSVRYFCVRDRGGRVRAQTVGYLLSRDSPYVFSRPDAVFSRDVVVDAFPSLTLGGRHPSHSQIWLDPSASEADRVLIVTELAAGWEREAGSSGARSVALLYADDELPVHDALTAAGYAVTPAGAAAVLDVPAGTFDDYLAGLPRSRREVVRRDRRRCRDAGCVVVVEDLHERHLPHMLRLEAQLYAKYGTPYRAEDMSALYHRLADDGLQASKIAIATMADRVVGFALFFHRHDVVHARCTGYDYDLAGRTPVYFETLYYALVDYAQRHEAREIRYSGGSLDVKQSRGCRLVPQHGYLKKV